MLHSIWSNVGTSDGCRALAQLAQCHVTLLISMLRVRRCFEQLFCCLPGSTYWQEDFQQMCRARCFCHNFSKCIFSLKT